VHRIVAVESTDEPFATRGDPIDHMSKAFRLWGRPKVEHVALVFSARVAHEIRERRWHPSELICETPDGGVRLEMDIAAPEELERLILGYGPDVVVEAPTSLATRVREVHSACATGDRFDMHRAAVHVLRPRRQVDTR
jgi:predicted DNA-binding transcriptional regulator YafY